MKIVEEVLQKQFCIIGMNGCGTKLVGVPKKFQKDRNMKRNTLQLISNLISAPIFGGVIFLVLIYTYNELLNYTQIILISAVSILFATVIPLSYIFLFVRKRRKIYQIDYDISNKSLRTKPFVVVIVSYAIGTAILFLLNAPVLVKGLMFCYFTNSLVMLFITLFWKISIHASGITGPLTVLIYKLGIIYSPLFLIVVPVGLVRIKLGKHTTLQIISGALLAILITWLQIVFIINPLF